MNRPYIICHMTQSIDGKVTGDFLYAPQSQSAVELYYEINRKYKPDGFICGRVTMETSFTQSFSPDLSKFSEVNDDDDFIADKLTGFYAVSFDPKGKVGWQSAFIEDEDPGYNKAQIIEVVSKKVNRQYLGYLKSLGISYIFAGEDEIDVPLALKKLKMLGINKLLLEGGSVINGYFQKADCVDELSLVVAPMISQNDGKQLFPNGNMSHFKLKECKKYANSVLWLNYQKE